MLKYIFTFKYSQPDRQVMKMLQIIKKKKNNKIKVTII